MEILIRIKGKTKYIIDWKNAYEFIENTYNVFVLIKLSFDRKARGGSKLIIHDNDFVFKAKRNDTWSAL